jgi:V-type H+-transporting ATPase subunit a
MFGDIAHGAFLFVFGIYLIFNRLNVEKGPLKIFSSLRYMITLMGFFAVYCGFIYNDFAGFNMNFFSSCFNPHYPLPDGETDTELIPIHSSKDCVYSFGIDPIWGRATNELVFVNSLKMKISVIIAIIHMTFGICIKAANTLYFKKKL